jgi:hypothetical protein
VARSGGDAFEIVKPGEMAKFGDKSFFNRKARNLSPVVSDDDLDLSPEIDMASRNRGWR